MVTVARSFDAPVKLLFPKDIFAAEFSFAMLGLGDIVIPGLQNISIDNILCGILCENF